MILSVCIVPVSVCLCVCLCVFVSLDSGVTRLAECGMRQKPFVSPSRINLDKVFHKVCFMFPSQRKLRFSHDRQTLTENAPMQRGGNAMQTQRNACRVKLLSFRVSVDVTCRFVRKERREGHIAVAPLSVLLFQTKYESNKSKSKGRGSPKLTLADHKSMENASWVLHDPRPHTFDHCRKVFRRGLLGMNRGATRRLWKIVIDIERRMAFIGDQEGV